MDRIVVAADQLPPEPKTAEDYERVAWWIAQSVMVGRLDSRTAGEAIKALGLGRLAHEKAELMRKLRQAERELAGLKKAAKRE